MSTNKGSKMTPGPWVLHTNEVNATRLLIYSTNDPSKGPRLYVEVDNNSPRSESDARAVAAVPELIAALRTARELLDATLGQTEWAPGGREWAEKRVATIDAALRKAGVL